MLLPVAGNRLLSLAPKIWYTYLKLDRLTTLTLYWGCMVFRFGEKLLKVDFF